MKAIFGIITISVLACTPAQEAEGTQIENKILADLRAGDGAEQIKTDVAAIVDPGNTGKDIVVITNDAIDLLIDLGLIHATLMANTQTVQAALSQKHLAGAKH